MGPLYGDLLGMSLSIALVKKYGGAMMPAVVRGGLARARLRQVVGYIEENLEREVRLEELAALAGLSVFHFARSFRESVGKTPHQFLVERRLERAKTLLAKPEWTVEQVAVAVGFGSAGRLAKSFRAVLGVSPSEWRRNT